MDLCSRWQFPQPRRIAFYGGSFDPVHRGHLAVAQALLEQFELDEFVFIPAFHAPHKVRLKPTSAYDRYAMLCLVTENEPNMSVSKMEVEMPDRPYSVQTLRQLNVERPDDEIFFVMGADSWMDIRTWREWETVLTMTNIIVVTRPDVEIGQTVPESLRARFYRNARATAESGWDFSSRWMRDPKDLRTLETVDLIPVDLNALLYNAERTIAALATFRHNRDGGQDDLVARRFTKRADERRQCQ